MPQWAEEMTSYGWLMPHYHFAVTDEHGVAVNPLAWCGVYGFPWSGTTWPDDYIVELAPGETREERVSIPTFVAPRTAYLVKFQYVFTPADGEATPALTGHSIRTVSQQGWSGKKNGELLTLMSADGFEVLLTVDQGVQHQQNLKAAAASDPNGIRPRLLLLRTDWVIIRVYISHSYYGRISPCVDVATTR